MKNEIDMYIVSYTDFGDPYDLHTRILGVYETYALAEQAKALDMKAYVENRGAQAKEVDVGNCEVWLDGGEYGCVWTINLIATHTKAMSENTHPKNASLVRESVKKFATAYQEGGKLSDEELEKFRAMLVNCGQDPRMVDLFIDVFVNG